MRFPYLVALILTVAGAGTFWYKSTAAVCPVPLSYKVGEIDAARGKIKVFVSMFGRETSLELDFLQVRKI